MRPLPHTIILAVAALAVGARAATVLDKTEVDFEKKLADAVQEVLKDEKPIENVFSDQELIDQANQVQEVENNLRNHVKVADIPVKVVVEESALKPDAEKEQNNEVIPESEDITRVKIDLANPGQPQRQEHETQNPEHYEDSQQALSSIKQVAIETQNAFNSGVAGIQQNLQSWLPNEKQLSQFQENIQLLQNGFQAQLDKLNQTVQNYWNPPKVPASDPPTEGAQVKDGIQALESHLKNGVKSLTEGVQAMASYKQGNESSSGSGGGFGSGFFSQQFQILQQQISHGFANITNQFQSFVQQNQNNSSNTEDSGNGNLFQSWTNNVQNLINQAGSNQPAAAQSDEGAPARPSLWQNIQSNIQNIFNPQSGQSGGASQGNQEVQADAPVTPQPSPGPIAAAIQNNPLYQSVVSLIQPNRPAANKPQKPEEKPQKPDEPAAEGTNEVPETQSKPAAVAQKEPKPEALSQTGPVQQFVAKNPVAQGIAGTIQRIQHITSPTKPRDALKEVEKVEKGYIGLGHGGGHGGHGGHGGGSDNNNDIGIGGKSEAQDAPSDPKKPEEVLPQADIKKEDKKTE